MLKSWIYVCLFGLLAGVKSLDEEKLKMSVGIIRNGETPICLGTVVAVGKKVTLVTAAHCVKGTSNLGVFLNDKNGTIKQVMVHPFYKPPLLDYDIAVLKTEFIDTPNELKSLTLTLKENDIPEKVCLIKVNPTNQTLEGFEDKKEDRQACQSKHGSKIKISTKMICAQSGYNILGGSALYYKNGTVLAGVASYTLNSTLPKIFTNIANPQIYKFIDQYI